MQLRRVIGTTLVTAVVPVLVQACGGQTAQDLNGNQNTGGLTWTANTSLSTGGSQAVWITQIVLTGGAWTVPGSAPPTSGVLSHTGGWTAAGGAIGVTGGNHAGGAIVVGGSTSTGGVTAAGGSQLQGGTGALGGTMSTGGTVITGGSHAGGTASGGTGSSSIGTSTSVQSPCLLPADSGPCDGALAKYFFNVNTGQCEAFGYGGCEGNANRFDTLQACQQRCSTDTSLCPATKPPTNVVWQCQLSAVCYYSQYDNYCNMLNGSLVCTGDAGYAADVAADASTPQVAQDAGMDVYLPRYWACTCGTPGWSCTAY